jgi:tetratricopeptide (TPR) repeat protein
MAEIRNNPHRRLYTTLIPLALAAAILAVAVGVILRWGAGYGSVPTNGAGDEPTWAQRVRQAALLSMRERKYDDAIRLMVTYIAKAPDDVEIRPLLARAYMAKGDNTKAEIIVDQAIQLSPHIAQVLWLKGELRRLRADGNYMNSFRAAVEQSADVTPDYWAMFGRELLAVNQTPEAAKWLQRAFDNGVKDGPTLAALGEAKLSGKEYAQAREKLEMASVKLPNDPHVSLLLATACRNLNDLKTAADIVTTTLRSHPSPELYMELGEIRLLQKRPLEAAEAFVEATHFSKFEQRAQAARKAAEIYYKHDLYMDKAVEMIKIAADLRPFDVEIQQLRAKILHAASRPQNP